ncbi:dimethylsulfonioproprionate lyase family protein [Paragemmobacter ruber]|uniref:Transcriptional regulator n=1 Tax=Paragemmobacter ruber TaxID=1985673 RepID=A0ABW9YAV7_9RHOB|nr:dimethylsulfonioproprionate lyase family protein [Rhodobacter ruber]NBE09552.1 hypothetical protein [Rhodobacter ruber]
MTDTPDTLLHLPPGTPGAGRIRYGAAMALYQQGKLSAATLEAFRIASASDTRPVDEVLAAHGLPPHSLAPTSATTAGQRLMDEVRAYLAPLTCPGAAELRRLIAQSDATATPPAPQPQPVVATHLPAALAALAPTHPALAKAIGAAAPHLPWASHDPAPPDHTGPACAGGHAFCPLITPDTGLGRRDAEFGLVLMAPHILCRDHSHPAPELYLPLTGPHGWRFGPARPLITKPAHRSVWHDAHRPHLIKVGPTPFLAFVFRTRDSAAPARILPAPDWPALESLRLTATP